MNPEGRGARKNVRDVVPPRDNSGHVAAITMRDPGRKDFRSSAVSQV